MRIGQVKHHVIKQVSSDDLEGYRSGDDFKELRLNPLLRDNWISFTAVDWDPVQGCLYIGLTAFDCDLLWRFWPDQGRFESLNFKEVSQDPQYFKIPRGLTPDGEGGYYFGTAGLPDLDELNQAPGGGVFHYHQGRFDFLGIPVEHDYIQNIEVDLQRGRVYGVTYPKIHFFDYDLERRETRFILYTASHFHESGLDDDGYFWGTWSARRGHCLFRYHPDQGQPEFFHQPIPAMGPEHIFNFPLNGPIDSFINGGDNYLYFGTTLGELYRLDPKTGTSTLLGRPSEGLRLSGLVPGPGNTLLGSYGAYNETGLFIYDRDRASFTDLGAMRDHGASCFMIHDIAWDGDSRVFAAETDNVDRSSFLWEATLE